MDFRGFTERIEMNEEDCDELKSDLRESCIFISEISLLKKNIHKQKTQNEGESNGIHKHDDKAEPDEICKTSLPTHMVQSIFVFFSAEKNQFIQVWNNLRLIKKDNLNDNFRFLVELKSVCFTQGNFSSLLQSTSKVAGGKRLFSRSHVSEHVIKDMSLQGWEQMSLQEIMIHDASSTGCRLHVVLVMRKLELDNSQHAW